LRRLETPPYRFALQDESQLRDLFNRALGAPNAESREHAALRDGVCALVARAKAEGRQVETIIVALKEIFAVPDRPNRIYGGEDDTPPPVLLSRRVIRWCISAYYDDA
jgi:hypothetical protein